MKFSLEEFLGIYCKKKKKPSQEKVSSSVERKAKEGEQSSIDDKYLAQVKEEAE